MLIPQYKLNDYFPTSFEDDADRHYISQGQDALAVGASILATNHGRVKALTMTGTSGTTIELYVNNVPQFVSGRPSVDGRTYDNPSYVLYNRGDVIKVLATVGPTAGTVLLDTEAHELIPRQEIKPTPARERFSGSLSRAGLVAGTSGHPPLQNALQSLTEASRGISERSSTTHEGSLLNREQQKATARTLEKLDMHWNESRPKANKPGGNK